MVPPLKSAFDLDPEFTERAIPIRPSDLVRDLAADPSFSPGESARFVQFARLLGAVFHYEYYDWLVELKDLYSPLDPDSDCVNLGRSSTAFNEDADEAFLRPFEAALIRANYRPLKLEIIKEAVSAPNENGLTYQPDFTSFEHMKVYARGRTTVSRTVRSLKSRFRKQEFVFPGYSRLVVILKFRDGGIKKLDPYARTDVIYLRLFKDVPHVDMEMHLPEQGTKVKMRLIDKAQIVSPMLTALPLLAAKVLLGWISPLAFGVLIAPFTAGANSFFGFQRAKQKHLAKMIRHLYYLTLANNASVINRLVDSAEEEDFKEALLAYYFLLRGHEDPEPWDQARLDHAVELYLKERTKQDVDFEVGDAVRKLLRLGLVHSDGRGHLSATPIEPALERLDQQWDDAFRYHRNRPPKANV